MRETVRVLCWAYAMDQQVHPLPALAPHWRVKVNLPQRVCSPGQMPFASLAIILGSTSPFPLHAFISPESIQAPFAFIVTRPKAVSLPPTKPLSSPNQAATDVDPGPVRPPCGADPGSSEEVEKDPNQT